MFENFLGGWNYPVGVTVPSMRHDGGGSSCPIRLVKLFLLPPCFLVAFCGIVSMGILPAILTLKGNTMNQKPVVSAVISALSENQTNEARKAGALFARSEIEASEALEVFARAVGESPTFSLYEQARIEWVSSYVNTKPHTKGNTADKAFGRFIKQLCEKYPLDIVKEKPVSDNPAATKKREEREAKHAEVLKAHEDISTGELRSRLTQAFTTLASNPDSKVASAAVKNLKAVIRERTKDESAALKADLTAKRTEIRGLLSGCDDIERLDAVIEILSPENDISIQ